MADEDDGLAAYMLRLGANQSLQGPDPKMSDGQFYLVVSGNLRQDAGELPLWSMLHAAPDEAAPVLRAGAVGCEVLVLQFPRPEAAAH